MLGHTCAIRSSCCDQEHVDKMMIGHAKKRQVSSLTKQNYAAYLFSGQCLRYLATSISVRRSEKYLPALSVFSLSLHELCFVGFDTLCDEHKSAQKDHLEEAVYAVLEDKDRQGLQDLRLPGTLRSTCYMALASSQCKSHKVDQANEMTQFAQGKDMSQHPTSIVTEALISFSMAEK
ncbi:hypothetical protein KCU95_g40, partial [Aureobasidium melanogenum]